MEESDKMPIWHHDVHRRITKEALHYFFIKFTPTYDRQTTFRAFNIFCARNSISSFSFLEVFGPVDLIFKCWVPVDGWRTAEDAYNRQKSAFAPGIHIASQELFDADECRYHWLWASEEAPGSFPELPPRASDEILSALSGGTAPIEGSSESIKLEKSNLLRFRPRQTPAIRFITVISAPLSGLPDSGKEHLVRRIVQELRSIRGIEALEVYEGRGTFWLLIDALVNFSAYHCLVEMHRVVNDAGIKSFYCRTTTYICSDNINGAIEQERISLVQQASRSTRLPDPDLPEYLLEMDESKYLEIKGSLRLDMHAFFASGDIKKEKQIEEKILQTIVGFRNSDGGIILIGAIEIERFPVERSTIEGNYPKVGKYYLCGMDIDFVQKGFDSFHRHLTDVAAERISETTAARLSITQKEIEGRAVAIVYVPPCNPGEFDYLDKKHFVIRRGASSKTISGVEQENYQRNRHVGEEYC